MSKPRILVIPGWYPSTLEPLNGDFIEHQVSIIRRAGYALDVVFYDGNIRYLSKGQISQCSRVSAYEQRSKDLVISGPTWPKNSVFGLHLWIKKFASHAIEFGATYGKPDIIHAHTYLGGAVAKRIAELWDKPYVITEHYTGWMTGNYRKSHHRLAKAAFTNADKITAVSKSLGDCLSREFAIQAEMVPNFIDESHFTLGTPHKEPIITCVGDLIKRKNWPLAIETVAQLRRQGVPCHLHMIGSGPEQPILERLCHRLGIIASVKFHGELSKVEVAKQLQKSSILLHTSHIESYGIVIAEALATGVPCVVVQNGGSAEFQDLKGFTEVTKPQPSIIAKIIQRVTHQSPTPQEIRDDYLKRFSSDKMVERILNIYASMT
ncbi:MAG: glycosyltransferase [Bacteroidota bacterium]